MSLKDDFFIVIKNISHRKLRSWLTVLGVVIGVAAIIALVAVGRSLESSIEKEFEDFGSDKITIVAAGGNLPGFGTGLTTKDVDAVKNVKGLEYVEGMLYESGKATHKEESINVFFFAWESDNSKVLFDDFGADFSAGAPFETDSNKIVIGSRVAADLFEKKLSLGSKLEIEDEKFEVAGILEPVGNPDDDSLIYMPMGVARELFDKEDDVSFMFAKVKPGSDIDKIADKITAELKKERSEESFNVITPEQLIEQVGTVLGIIEGVLVGIAGISLIVGSVGIAGSMYTSVIERTRDVGIMKAVGATNNEITAMFLIEAGLMGLVGGIIGVMFGFLIASMIGFAIAQAGFTFLEITVEPWLVLFGLAFALIVGMLSGFFPARQAARLKPVEALRK